jgi:hypothetical protein
METSQTQDDELDPQPDRFRSYWTPEVLGLVGFALAVGSMLGAGVLSGAILAALGTEAGTQTPPSVQVLAGLLGAAFAALPLLLGLEAVRNLLEDDPLWVAALARATVLLAGIVVFLRLAQTLAQTVSEGGSPYFGY